MGTKVLNPSLREDCKRLKHALHVYNRRCSKITDSLINTQRRWILNENQQGIQRSKDLYDHWKRWIATGCNPAVIPPNRYRHSLLGRLQDAMRLVVYTDDVDKRNIIINLISSSLRYHELHGPSPKTIALKTQDLIATITSCFPDKPIIIAYHFPGNCESFFSSNSEQLNTYKAAKMLVNYCKHGLPKFSGVSKTGGKFPLNFGVIPLRVETDSAELLVKKSPHKITIDGRQIRLRSIAAEPLDIYALSSHLHGRTRYVSNDGQLCNGVDPSLQGKTLMNLLEEMSAIMMQPEFQGAKWTSRQILGSAPSQFKICQGEIIPIEDKAGKVRPIATSVYTVNEVLAPLHRWIFSLIKRFPCDATDQAKGLKLAQDLSSDRQAYVKSADLTSATDTLPRLVQRIVLENCLKVYSNLNDYQSERLAYLWDVLMGSLKFETPLGQVSYGTGQPMGVYTSWPMLALTNHVIVQASIYSETDDGRTVCPFLRKGYAVCGDDVFLTNKTAAQNYTFMMNSFGVKVNELKSYESLPGQPTCIEFCKRLYVDGRLVTGSSLKALYQATEKNEVTLVPSAVESILHCSGTKVLPKVDLLRIAGRYPRSLIHIPMEYGGLGSVCNVSRTDILSKDGFLILYYYKRLKSIRNLYHKTDFSFDGTIQDHESLAWHIELVEHANVPTTFPGQHHDSNKEAWQHLLNRKPFTGSETDFHLLDGCIQRLHEIIYDGFIPKDEIGFVDDLTSDIHKVLANVKPNIFKGTGRIHDSESSYNEESIKLTKVALSIFKMIKAHHSGKKEIPFLSHFEDHKGFYVSLVEFFDALL